MVLNLFLSVENLLILILSKCRVLYEDPGKRHLEKKVLDALVLPAHVVSKIQSTKYN